MKLRKIIYNLVFSLFLIAISIFFIGLVSAANCWQYTSSSTCTSGNGCNWRNDSWSSSGWCEELNCWSLNTQSACTSTNVPGKNCTWQGGGTNYGCEKLNCWGLSGTSANSCVNNSAGLSCEWGNMCYSSGSTGGSTANCAQNNNQSSCLNMTGCNWGSCSEKGCWSYSASTTCNAAKDWNGKNCTWNSNSYCEQNGCWKYTSNQSVCESAAGLNCEWKWNSCQEASCYSWDFTNATACLNNSLNLSCSWAGSYCNRQDCWGYNTQASCQNKSECLWKAYVSSGWCNQIDCWNWDSGVGANLSIVRGNKTICESNGTIYGLNCVWTGNPPGNETSGWCYKNIATIGCSNKTTERDCMDTMYCWWQYANWSNPSSGGTCSSPGGFGGGGSNATIFNDWSPGCYIFDMNSSDCNNIVGCNYTSGLCQLIATNTNNFTILNRGLNCSMVNESGLCNNIPVLSSCCAWQNGSCTENKLSSACKDQMQQKNENSCEDAKTQTRCNQIASSPWYMPCDWSNSTSKCLFKTADIFGGNGSQSITLINNKMSCEAAGGKWILENYCEGNISIPTGRCEYKFDEEDNCDKACFACELKDSSGNTVNATNAESSCEGSGLGFCEFTANANASNGIGYCQAKEQFKKGIAGDCNSNCGDCTFKGQANTNDTTKRPSYYCGASKANSDGGGCKWITDNSTITGGYCVKKGEKTCEDACDRCNTQSNCANLGRTAGNLTAGGCKWDGSTSSGSCVMNTDADAEICWDGIDNNNNNLVDCADSSCYSDSFCGLVEGNCFGWTNNNTCIANSCEWVTDKWGGWCDFKGSQCWKYNVNSANCTGIINVANENINITTARLVGNEINISKTFTLINKGGGWVEGSIVIRNLSGASLAGNYSANYSAFIITFANDTFMTNQIENITNVTYKYYSSQAQKNCQWSNGTGNGMCEQDWSKGEVCMGLTRTGCYGASASNCLWSNDTWCSGSGNGTEWCSNNGGWCDYSLFKPKNCWTYSNSSTCNTATGCNWQRDSYSQPHCEVDWSANCWNYTSSLSCNAASNCVWDVPPQGGGWCTNKADKCWNYDSETCASAMGGRCYWQSWGSGTTGGGSCQAICGNSSFNTQSTCSSSLGCFWKEDNGWCQESGGCWNFNQTGCTNATGTASGCRWKESGWCDPKGGGFSTATTTAGGGMGGAMGSDCYKYDGNQTLCTNKSIINMSCGWSTNPTPTCEVDWSSNCWQYSSVTGGCNSTNSCWFKNDTTSSYCTNIMDQCWSNQTYQMWNNSLGWAGNCSSNPLCINNSWGSCEPRCSSKTSSPNCIAGELAGKCRWTNGWCNSGTMNEMFNNMEAGASAPIGMDACPENGTQASVDICGFGMKDMGDSYGFGAGVKDFSNASICNKEKLSSFVMGMAESPGGAGMSGGGGMTNFGTERTGAGTDTITYILYLDSDGSTINGCSLDSNSSAVGYEFRFKYTSQWNSNLSKAAETFNADKCDNSNWKATDIKLSTWKKKMCSDIGGPMIAVKKDDLTKFPTLYDSTKDLRIYVATIGNSGNISYPTDTAGPGWTTPGSVDFEIKSAFDYGADTAKFENILKKGFAQGEDCFNSIDDDSDSNIDCNDWDCQYSSKCSGIGVNAPGYADTSSPLVTGIKIEEYTDAALIMYDTNKPTNGTLELYGYGDTQCLNKTNNIYDIGLLSANVPDYKLWHTAVIYETNEIMNGKNVSIQWPLVAGSTYNYKLRVCDSNGKCAVSRCSSFKTASSEQKCGYCSFVTRIKAPTGWSVAYDTNRNGTYEYVQGQMCGANAGMKMNYTLGRRVNIKLYKDDSSMYIEFLNASLTKTGLNDKVRTISTAGDLIGSSTLVGLTSETRDKIINNLHPEVCRIKIPVASGATCNRLYHCDDSGLNCVDRTSAAGGAPVDSVNCVWNVPNCEFSTYKTSAASSTTTASGGGGGGGGSSSGKILTISEKQFSEGYTQTLSKNDRVEVNISNEWHSVKLVEVGSSTVTINVSSATQQAVLSTGDARNFDVTSDSKYDLNVKLNSLNSTATTASLTITRYVGQAEVVKEVEEKAEEKTSEGAGEPTETSKLSSKLWIWIVIAVIVILLIAIFFKKIKKR